VIAETKGGLDPLHKTLYAYNDAGCITEVTDPVGNVTHIAYSGHAQTVTNPKGNITTFEYGDMPGLPTHVTDAQGNVAEYSYDALGRLISARINNERPHSYQYDLAGNLISETHPETGTITYVYDDDNRVREKHWGGTVTKYYYNGQSGQLYLMTSGDETSIEEEIHFTYIGARLHRVDSSKGWKRWPIYYDGYGNVTSETIYIPGLPAKTITYEYDLNGNLKKTNYPDGEWTQSTYNGLNCPETLAFNSTGNLLVSGASYGPGKSLAGLTLARNGTQLLRTYFNSGALASNSLQRGGSVLIESSYNYDDVGNISSISSTAPTPSLNAAFDYDSLNRLTSATYSSGRVNSFAYSYDAFGNMTSAQEGGFPVFTKSYNANNRFSDGSYDARGNLVSWQDAIYHWNYQNRLAYVTNLAGEIQGKYLYDERGLRMAALPPFPEADVYTGSPEVEVPDGGGISVQCPLGQDIDTTFLIRNPGEANLELTGSPKVTIAGDVDQFRVLTQPSSPVSPSGVTSFVIRFSPTSIGRKTAAITIVSNDLNENPYDITLTGNLDPPEIQIVDVTDGGTWDFGLIRVGQSQQWPFMIQNVGEADLILNGNPRVQITGDEMGQFFVEEQPDGTVGGGGYTFFIIRFSPVAEGPATAQVSIQNNDADENPYNFTLMGTGQGWFGLKADDPEIKVMAPAGNEKIIAGQPLAIAWTGGAATQSVRIEYSNDNGSTYKTIAERAPNTGRFDWVAPPALSPVCLVRIADADGLPVSPRAYLLGFDLKTLLPPEMTATGTDLMIRMTVPDVSGQATLTANFVLSTSWQVPADNASLSIDEISDVELRLDSGEWRHFLITLDLDRTVAAIAVDGEVVLHDVPLDQMPISSDRPELVILPGAGSSTKIWLDNLDLSYQDRSQIIRVEEPTKLVRPILSDSFDRYLAGAFPAPGGWKIGQTSSDGTNPTDISESTGSLPFVSDAVFEGQYEKNEYYQGIAGQSGTIAIVDQTENVTPRGSFKFERIGPAPVPIVKRFALPSRIPFDVSSAGFSIVAEDTELEDLMDQMIEERTHSDAAGTGVSSEGSAAGPSSLRDLSASGSSQAQTESVPMTETLTSPRAGSYYIYSFDGRLLAEYDLLGNCLRDYLYMGNRLVAEYVPATDQYYYYSQDHVGSTSVVTDDSGAVVYAEAHDPYGGIQKTWANSFDPKRKFADKERDEETGLDYFAARFYSAPMYRWLSVDPALYLDVAIKNPQAWNLYSFCRNNPVNLIDPTGQVVIADDGAYSRLQALFGYAGIRLTRDANGKVSVCIAPGTEERWKEEYPELACLIDWIVDDGIYVYIMEGDTSPTSKGNSPVDWAGINYSNGPEHRATYPRPPKGYDVVVVMNPSYGNMYGDKDKPISWEAILYHEFHEAYFNVMYGLERYPSPYVKQESSHYWSGVMEEVMLKSHPNYTVAPAGSGPRGPFGGSEPHRKLK